MKRIPIAGLVLIAAPAIALAVLLLLYGVDVPFWDQWSIVGLSEAFHLHRLTFSELFAQFNEDRLFFPRLLLLTINALAHGNVKYQMLGTLLVAILTMFNVFLLAKRTMSPKSGWTLLTLASLLIFSPIQYQNWLWGNQISNLMPIACLTTALAVSYSDRSPWVKLSAAAVLSTVATFSYPNGTTCWVLLLPALLLQFKDKPSRLLAAGIWIALAAANVAGFFYHYRFLEGNPGLAELLAQIELVVVSFLAFLGAPLSFGAGLNPERVAHFVGAAIVLLVVVACMRFIRVWRKSGMLERCLPWLTIGTFTLATSVIVTIGRATTSTQRLLESRYTSFSVYLLVALIFLWPIVFEEAKLRPWVGCALVLWILVLHVCTTRYAIAQMNETRTDRLESKACLAFFNLIDDPCQTQRLDWDLPVLRQRVQSLDRLDFFHPPLVRSADLKLIAGAADPSSKQYGVFESLANVGGGFYRATGWATLPQRSEPADAVVLSYVRADGVPAAFALADWMKYDRPFAWEKWFKLPSGAERIQAWAYDALSGRAYLLAGEQRAANAPVTAVRFVPQGRGFVDAGELSEATALHGWAVLLSQHKPADMVLLTCGDNNVIVAAGQPWEPRPDVARTLEEARYLKSGWQIPITPEKLPAGCNVKAWAYDASANEAGLLRDLR